ncbi:TetR/AcrR family transcriptional regulator [Pseudonocardia xinjiangensis]|uniref:TetR/AcrR family transcriptional regulator n=1 Tax=Pseudonocardia xinjiangensis TaxID=75289 RepID=A0ABX1RSQ9_9PSEU|nr:TetR/AcrR family transcriptional regulator [Pseudonocardia xinjiangensis]NMH82579.1 TetR/AcrR family transcriptional regulator [Pseudonocardia xinjiangensis]
MTRRRPTGAAVLQPAITRAITEAVLDEWAAHGYARLSMEAVAKRAGVGKSALYRRWPSKQEMAIAAISEFSVARAVVPDTGALRTDLRETLDALMEWLTHPRFSRILPDLVAETARNPELAGVVAAMIGTPRRERATVMFRRAIERGELREDTDLELVQDLLAAPVYWRLTVRAAEAEPGYLDALADLLLRAIGAQDGEQK